LDLKNNIMDTINYKNVLLETAVSAIACDGDIDDREIEALKNIEKNSPYFSSEDLSKTLEKSLKKCSKDVIKYQKSVFNKINKGKLNLLQELTLMEISLRIIAADEIEEDSERDFIINLRKCLSISDLILFQRFGKIEYLGLLDFEQNFIGFKKPEDPSSQLETK
tara:strand:+ start:72 stop:566 length:495 start_codon:yes stop_codon:yes gene_type:complete